MKKIFHPADSRGFADMGWLKTHHSFNFGRYYNPNRSGFGTLRVLNDDELQPGTGFKEHPHENMEIITIILKGSLEHVDSTGNKRTISKNDIQVMSAGTGISHSEKNPSQEESTHLLQIWISPKEKNKSPRYNQKSFPPEDGQRQGPLQLIVSPDESDHSTLWINQQAYLTIGRFRKGENCTYNIHHFGNGVYFFVVKGHFRISGEDLIRRDAIGISANSPIRMKALSTGEILIIEVPPH